MKKKVVLAVDDQPDNLYVLRSLIADGLPACEVITETDPRKALTLAASRPFDGLLLDVQMPGLGGIDMCRRLKSDPKTAAIPIILITAHQTDGIDKAEGLSAGADDFLTKPLDHAELIARLKVMLRIKESADEKEASRKRSEHELKLRNRIAQVLFASPGEEMYAEVLGVLLQAFASAYGVFGYINETGELVCPSMTTDIWDECEVPGKCIVFPTAHWTGLWGGIIKGKKPLYSNGGLRVPKGHVPLERALGAPILYGDKAIGLILLANKKSNYNADECAVLAAVANYIAPLLKTTLERERTEKKYRRLFECSQDALMVINPNLVFVSANPAAVRLFGCEKEEELLGKTIADVSPQTQPDGSSSAVSAKKQAARILERGAAAFDWKFRRLDGGDADAAINVSLVDWEGGKMMLCSVRDVTELKAAQQNLRQKEYQLLQSQKLEAIGRLAGGVAHDFNNMLTAIIACANFLADDIPPEDPKRQDVDEILDAAQKAAALTGRLLAFSRKQVLDLKVHDLNGIVSDMEKMLKRTLGEDIRLSTALTAAAGKIKVDSAQMQNVILNLALNSRDAMAQGGRLIIETGRLNLEEELPHDGFVLPPGDYALLSVSDTGCGMSPGTQERLFEPFFTTKEKGKGTGLGMSSVFGIVKQSGGYISVYSEKDKGTTIKIYLPAAEKGGAQDAPPKPASMEFGGKETVLVAEDDHAVRNTLRRILKKFGYHLLLASSGEDALEIARNYKGDIDLLLTDVVMPGMDGLELSKQLETDRKKMKILFMSGYTDEIIARHGVLEPGLELVSKPFSPLGLALRIRRLLDR